MFYCKLCGRAAEGGDAFCKDCGADFLIKENLVAFSEKFNGDPEDIGEKIDMSDISENRFYASLSYLGPLVIIPVLFSRNSKFVRFHANQGLCLFAAALAYSVIYSLLKMVMRSVFPIGYESFYLQTRGALYDGLSVILALVWFVFIALALLGFLIAICGRVKRLPMIGKFRILR